MVHGVAALVTTALRSVVTRALRSALPSCHASAWHDDCYRRMGATFGNRNIATIVGRNAITRATSTTEGGRLLPVVRIVTVPCHFHVQAVRVFVFAVVIGLVYEDVFYRCIEYVSNPERYFQRGRVLIALDRDYRLTAYADEFCQLLLRHLTAMESIPPNDVGKRHDSRSPAIVKELHGRFEGRRRNPAAN